MRYLFLILATLYSGLCNCQIDLNKSTIIDTLHLLIVADENIKQDEKTLVSEAAIQAVDEFNEMDKSFQIIMDGDTSRAYLKFKITKVRYTNTDKKLLGFAGNGAMLFLNYKLLMWTKGFLIPIFYIPGNMILFEYSNSKALLKPRKRKGYYASSIDVFTRKSKKQDRLSSATKRKFLRLFKSLDYQNNKRIKKQARLAKNI